MEREEGRELKNKISHIVDGRRVVSIANVVLGFEVPRKATIGARMAPLWPQGCLSHTLQMWGISPRRSREST